VRPVQLVVERPANRLMIGGVVPGVTSVGGLGVFYTEASIKTLIVTGELKSLYAKGGAVLELTAGALGKIRMDAAVNSSGGGRVENTFLHSTGAVPANKPASIQLTGVLLQELTVPGQKVLSLKVGPKKYLDRQTGLMYLSYGAVPDGVIQVGELGRVTVLGGAFQPDVVLAGESAGTARLTVQGAAFVIGQKGAFQRVFLPGVLSPGVVDVQAPLSLTTVGGDAKPSLVISSGQVALFSAKPAKFRGTEGVQYVGGRLGLEAADFETTQTRENWEAAVGLYLSPDLRSVLLTQSTVVISGAGESTRKNHIGCGVGGLGGTGIFISGASKQTDGTWMPDFSATVGSIATGKAVSGAVPPEIRGESWAAKPIKWSKKSLHSGFVERDAGDLP
jgi:hypothetical protein